MSTISAFGLFLLPLGRPRLRFGSVTLTFFAVFLGLAGRFLFRAADGLLKGDGVGAALLDADQGEHEKREAGDHLLL